MVAERFGFFRETGLDARLAPIVSGVEMRSFLIGGTIDIATMADVPFLVGAEKVPLVAIGLAVYGGAKQKIMVAPGSGISQVRDLIGKRVGSQVGTAQDDNFREVLRRHNLSEKEVMIINIRNADHVATLQAGSVHAIVTTEPFGAILEEQGLAKPLMNFGEISPAPALVITRRDFLQKNSETLVSFLRGWDRAMKFIAERQEPALNVLYEELTERGLKLSRNILVKNFRELYYTADINPDIEEWMKTNSKQLVNKGRLKKVPDVANLIDRTLLARARREGR
jgi:NitT/TauT family transport system substrate-binding protein